MSNVINFPLQPRGERIEDYYARISRPTLEKETNKLSSELATLVSLIEDRAMGRITADQFDEKMLDIDFVIDFGFHPDEMLAAFRKHGRRA